MNPLKFLCEGPLLGTSRHSSHVCVCRKTCSPHLQVHIQQIFSSESTYPGIYLQPTSQVALRMVFAHERERAQSKVACAWLENGERKSPVCKIGLFHEIKDLLQKDFNFSKIICLHLKKSRLYYQRPQKIQNNENNRNFLRENMN